jgi:alpha-galactosidase
MLRLPVPAVRTIAALLFAYAMFGCLNPVRAATLASSPPMGWNSWDAYGFTIDEADFKANASVLAQLRPFGWTYAVIDEGWYMANPSGDKLETRNYQLDAHGLLVPDSKRFPSAAGAKGLRPLADWIHAQGLKLGIHIVRGIPKQAVRDNLPIAHSNFRSPDAADTADTCSWDDGNYGVQDNAAGQAYYDSMFELYARWGIDFVKVDCIADHPYKGSEIRQIAKAIEHARRPMVLSLSPGPTQLSHAEEIARYAQMWRISNDIWDGWRFAPIKPNDDFPNGVETAFVNLAKWNPHVRPGRWPDADMLPFGSLTPHPGWGEPRASRLTHAEEQTQFVLWAIARSPLILGCNLTQLDELTRSLLTNRDLIEVNQGDWTSRPVEPLPAGWDTIRAWIASRGSSGKPGRVVALFNLADAPKTVKVTWSQLGVSGKQHVAHAILGGTTGAAAESIEVTLPAHGSAAYRLD